MILRNLELDSFARFYGENFEFRRGINLVIGPNEAGKSTMLESIAVVLFGSADKKRFIPWVRSDSCAAALHFENHQQNICIRRDIVSDKVLLQVCDDLYRVQEEFGAVLASGEHSPRQLEYRDYLRRFIGISDERLFRVSLFLRQGDFPTDAAQIQQQLRTLLSGFTRVDCEMVRRSLQDDYMAVTNEHPWHYVETAPRELEAVKEALEQVEQQLALADDLRQQLRAIATDLAAMERQQSADREDYRQGMEYLDWLQQRRSNVEVAAAGITAPARNDETGDDLERECRQLEQALEDAGLPRQIPPQLPALLAEADEIRCALIASQQRMVPLRRQMDAVAVPTAAAPVLLTVVAALAAGGCHYFYPQWLMTGVVAAGSAAASGWGSFIYRRRKALSERAQIQQQLDAIELEREEERDKLSQLDDQFEQHGLSTSAVELVRMKRMLEVHGHILERLSEVRLLMQQQDDKAGEQCDSGASLPPDQDMAGSRGSTDGHLSAAELPAARQRLEELQAQINARETEILLLLRRQAELQGQLPDSDELARRRQMLQARMSTLEQRRRVLECACSVLDEAMEEFYRFNLGNIEKAIGGYLRQASNGTYNAVSINENFAVTVKTRRGGWLKLETLSRGTIDMVCLAMRLALSRFLTGDLCPPFFMDDPLINLDSDRLESVVTALERLSSEHQIIIFSHDERLRTLAGRHGWHIVPLDRQRRLRGSKKRKQGAGSNDGQLSFL